MKPVRKVHLSASWAPELCTHLLMSISPSPGTYAGAAMVAIQEHTQGVGVP